MENIINPSILSANFINLERDLYQLKESGINKIHVDVMDGHFVPNITFGVDQIKQLKESTDFYLDCHLMVQNPETIIDKLIDISVGCITLHVESSNHIYKLVQEVKKCNVDCGIALNPGTSIYNIIDLLDIIDKILIMTVNPGFGGQKFIEHMLKKIRLLSGIMNRYNINSKIIQVDGGINLYNIDTIYDLGVRDIVVGSYIFSGDSIYNNINGLKNKISRFM
ncbi:Ribulose-phosphate 3-epimerase [Candidatus Arthromitus sp. SFB-mouse-NL]|uniref:ribulose-phosphate 3-epimerase n=1 Tax=Candidatus Arthromitus sp. SFB-mouse-NL TaxID=1508644 RepID=UPI00049B55A3|nr:ribulose-phosphate 3-epimerase [Candidatus Arthromitus sp. SFB-mouse-NL]AID44269.1 Ribulose-phosphate 3-epimerase [Candidatus Arthromitus sp. SFB-mouse-NL]